MRTWIMGEAGQGIWRNMATGAHQGSIGSGQFEDSQETWLNLDGTGKYYSRQSLPQFAQPTVAENESTDVYDHIDDFGNAGVKTTIGGWTRPWHPMMPKTPEYGYKPKPRAAVPEPWYEDLDKGHARPSPTPVPTPPEKSFWDKITPGDTQSPRELFPESWGGLGLVPGTLLPMPKNVPGALGDIDVMPGEGVFKLDQIGNILPMVLLFSLLKE